MFSAAMVADVMGKTTMVDTVSSGIAATAVLTVWNAHGLRPVLPAAAPQGFHVVNVMPLLR